MADATVWNVTPALSAAGGGGPVGGTVSQFIIEAPDIRVSAVFAGLGLSVGGPASFTYADSETRGFPGPLIWRYGLSGIPDRAYLARLLTCSTTGFMYCVGTCPRQIANMFVGRGIDMDALSGMYFMIIGFCMGGLPIGSSVLIDLALGANGWALDPDVTAYAVVASLAKGIDVGGAEVMTGSWLYLS